MTFLIDECIHDVVYSTGAYSNAQTVVYGTYLTLGTKMLHYSVEVFIRMSTSTPFTNPTIATL